MDRIINRLFLFSIFSLVIPKGHALESYGTYGLYPQTSMRLMAMGGAYTGLSNTPDGININPAGLAWSEPGPDFSSSDNTVKNREADFGNGEERDGETYNYMQYAGTLNIKNIFATGFSYSSPFKVEIPFTNFIDGSNVDVAVESTSLDLPIAIRVGRFSFGITLHQETIEQSFQSSGTTAIPKTSQDQSLFYASFGASWFPNDIFSMGISYSMKRKFEFDQEQNSSFAPFTFYRDVVIPSTFHIGTAFRFGKRFAILTDLTTVFSPGNAIYFGSGLAPAQKDVAIDSNDKYILHAGFEWTMIESKFVDLIVRTGGYQEPNLIKGEDTRGHLTGGIEARLAIFSFAYAIDHGGNDFLNETYGFSLSF